MIIRMTKVRLLGPRDRLPEVVRVVQDVGVLHLATPGDRPLLRPTDLTDRDRRRRRQLGRLLDDTEAAMAGLQVADTTAPPRPAPTLADYARWARLADRLRRAGARLGARAAALAEERALIAKYRAFFSAFEALRRAQGRLPNASAYQLLLRPDQAEAVPRLRQALAQELADAFELRSQPLETGETAVLLLVPATVAERVDALLAETRVQEIPVPAAYGGGSLVEAIPRMLERFERLPAEIEQVTRERAALAREHGVELARIRATVRDALMRYDALPLTAVTPRAFVMEGWLPEAAHPRLAGALATAFGDAVVIERVGTEHWEGAEAPVVLQNPRLFRPFEAIVGMMPLPRYGSIDPTPFVAVFFPMFFGLILGDIGYGLALAALAAVLHRRSHPDTMLRAVSEIAGACAAFSILFGLAFGEFLGNLGHMWFGLEPLVLNREEAVVPFLGLAVALGLVHILLGLVLGAVSAGRHHPREAVGRGLSAVMILLILVALLATVEVLPAGLFTPAVVALLVAFPVLVVAEGIVAPVELLSTVGNILSYARIMALGTASVMLAVVANQMVGALGSAVVGVLFALLFHLVNFALGLFSPTIHALRLHYVEFFGKFYSPGGTRYAPLAHWHGPGNLQAGR